MISAIRLLPPPGLLHSTATELQRLAAGIQDSALRRFSPHVRSPGNRVEFLTRFGWRDWGAFRLKERAAEDFLALRHVRSDRIKPEPAGFISPDEPLVVDGWEH